MAALPEEAHGEQDVPRRAQGKEHMACRKGQVAAAGMRFERRQSDRRSIPPLLQAADSKAVTAAGRPYTGI